MLKSAAMLFAMAFASSVIPATAFAQAAVAQSVQAGMTVKDTAGADVGVVTNVENGMAFVKTDRHEARLPLASFTPHAGHLLFGMTREQLNAQVDAALAKAQAQIVAGASVFGSAGAPAGTVEAADEQYVTLKLPSGGLVKLPKSAVAAGANGLVIGMSSAELEAAASTAAKPAS